MTSPVEHPPTEPTPARQATGPLRELVAIVLLGANAVFLFVTLIRLITPQGAYSTVTGRAGSAFYGFVGLEAIVLPLLAVLLATHLAPVVGKAKLITQVALIEYAVSVVLGGLTLLIWTVGRLAEAQIFDALTGVITRAAWVALFGAAAYVVWTVWRRLYHVPKPKQEPGLYGTPQQGWAPQGNPGQPGGYPGGWQQQPGPGGGWAGGDQPGGYPGQPSGYPGAGQPAGYPGQPSGYPGEQPSGYPGGQPGGDQPGWPVAGQAPGGPPSAPHTWPPHGQPVVPPQPPAPTSPAAPPFGQPPSADPTQTIPRQGTEPGQAVPPPGEGDRTQRIDPGDKPA
ncbi:hypothetical protein ABT008_30025 [Micromonospora sp. NPDC002389]|uniref:hypothetical protein n=1 Tax=Micromonospora sp. NPDC002389 TaxID=3154272 RepID=UPI003326CBB3